MCACPAILSIGESCLLAPDLYYSGAFSMPETRGLTDFLSGMDEEEPKRSDQEAVMADELNPPVDPVEPVPATADPADPTVEPAAEPAPDAAELERLRTALAKANKEAEKNRLR